MTDLLINILQRLVNRQRLQKLKTTAAKDLKIGHIDSLELLELIKTEFLVQTIYDVGSNVGTWTLLAKAVFPEAKIFAFEPLSEHNDAFRLNTRILDDVTLFENGLGNINKTLPLNKTSYSDASSVLEITSVLTNTYNIRQEGVVEINMRKLDDLLAEDTGLIRPDLIKLDIQGYELEALKGSLSILNTTKYIIMEVSFIEYYKDQPLFEDVILFMNSLNFKVSAFGKHTPTGRTLSQIDVLFVNSLI